jgi:hypothetical protein
MMNSMALPFVPVENMLDWCVKLGGPDLPGIGYAFGLERIISLLNKEQAWEILS